MRRLLRRARSVKMPQYVKVVINSAVAENLETVTDRTMIIHIMITDHSMEVSELITRQRMRLSYIFGRRSYSWGRL